MQKITKTRQSRRKTGSGAANQQRRLLQDQHRIPASASMEVIYEELKEIMKHSFDSRHATLLSAILSQTECLLKELAENPEDEHDIFVRHNAKLGTIFNAFCESYSGDEQRQKIVTEIVNFLLDDYCRANRTNSWSMFGLIADPSHMSFKSSLSPDLRIAVLKQIDSRIGKG